MHATYTTWFLKHILFKHIFLKLTVFKGYAFNQDQNYPLWNWIHRRDLKSQSMCFAFHELPTELSYPRLSTRLWGACTWNPYYLKHMLFEAPIFYKTHAFWSSRFLQHMLLTKTKLSALKLDLSERANVEPHFFGKRAGKYNGHPCQEHDLFWSQIIVPDWEVTSTMS
jgi:hypothetical protein